MNGLTNWSKLLYFFKIAKKNMKFCKIFLIHLLNAITVISVPIPLK